jgi:hypothetical protein
MNENLTEILKIYATQNHKAVSLYLLEQSKDGLIALFNELLTTYINDKNSSTLREFITVNIAGYKHSSEKIGYNGYKHSSVVAGTPLMCEAKPKNFDTESYAQFKTKDRKSSPAKLNGQGNFTDYTWARFEKDKAANLNMLVSGFVDGRLLYIFEFPFNSQDFTAHLEEQLQKRFPNGDKTSEYLRGVSFSYNNFVNCAELNVCYILEKDKLEEYKNYIIGGFYKWMLSKTK